MKKSLKITLIIIAAIIGWILMLAVIGTFLPDDIMDEQSSWEIAPAISILETTLDTNEFDEQIVYLDTIRQYIVDTALLMEIEAAISNKDDLRGLVFYRVAQKRISDINEYVEKQFSAWDGSHIMLKRYVKAQMSDPDSFEHVEAGYWIVDDYIVVRMVFSGKNAFGGRVRNAIKAKCDIETGNVIEVIQFD